MDPPNLGGMAEHSGLGIISYTAIRKAGRSLRDVDMPHHVGKQQVNDCTLPHIAIESGRPSCIAMDIWATAVTFLAPVQVGDAAFDGIMFFPLHHLAHFLGSRPLILQLQHRIHAYLARCLPRTSEAACQVTTIVFPSRLERRQKLQPGPIDYFQHRRPSTLTVCRCSPDDSSM